MDEALTPSERSGSQAKPVNAERNDIQLSQKTILPNAEKAFWHVGFKPQRATRNLATGARNFNSCSETEGESREFRNRSSGPGEDHEIRIGREKHRLLGTIRSSCRRWASKLRCATIIQTPCSHRISASARSLKGAERQRNEDRYWISRDDTVFVVADGMGGCPAGDVASQLTVDVLAEQLAKPHSMSHKRNALALLNNALQAANSRLLDFSCDHDCPGMGATVVAAVRKENRIFIASVGDCRAYLFRQQKLEQLTSDDTLSKLIGKTKALDPNLVHPHAFKNLLVRYIGTDPLEPVNDIVALDLQAGDRLILCTDGLVKALDDDQIAMALLMTDTAEAAATRLERVARAAQARDDTTCLVIDANDDRRGPSVSTSVVSAKHRSRPRDVVHQILDTVFRSPADDRQIQRS